MGFAVGEQASGRCCGLAAAVIICICRQMALWVVKYRVMSVHTHVDTRTPQDESTKEINGKERDKANAPRIGEGRKQTTHWLRYLLG